MSPHLACGAAVSGKAVVGFEWLVAKHVVGKEGREVFVFVADTHLNERRIATAHSETAPLSCGLTLLDRIQAPTGR